MNLGRVILKMIDLSIVVPCYNEEKNIPLIVNIFNKFLPKDVTVELILVNNGSSDSSYKVINQLMKQFKFLKKVDIKKNIGYGNGIWQGLKSSKGEFTCWTHADMQTDLYDTIKAFKIIKKEKDATRVFVKGKRKHRQLFDSFFTLGMTIFELLVLKMLLTDINAQPNLFHRSFLKNFANPPKDFSFDLYIYYMAKKLKFKIIKFPVFFLKRVHGSSKWNTGFKSKIEFIKRTINFTFKLKKNMQKIV